MVWGTVVMEQFTNLFKNERISVAALILVVGGLFWVHAWADERFAKVEDLVQLQQTVETGFESIAIESASQEIRDVKLSKQIAQATGSPETAITRIQERLDHVVSYKQCLVERGSNCEHLRDVE